MFIIAASIAFGPALHAPFDFDDYPAIVHNTTIRTLVPPWAPLHTPPLGTPASGRPAANVSFALSYALNEVAGVDQTAISADRTSTVDTRDAALGFRLANVFLHVLTAVLIFAALRLTLEVGRVPHELRDHARSIAFVIALIWMIHPLQTEAVDYISQRTEILVSLCYVATLVASIRHWQLTSGLNIDRTSLALRAAKARRWFAFTVATSVVGMASKEVMITAPLVIALHDRAFLSDRWCSLFANRARRLLYAALFATTFVAVALIIAGGRAATVGFNVGITPLEYLITQGWAIPHYLRLAFWPTALTYDYGQTPVVGVASVAGLALLCALAMSVIWCWTRPRLRWLAFIGTMFFLVLAPSSSIVPIRTEIAAERRVYLALVAVVAAVVVGMFRLLRANNVRIAITVVVVAGLLTASARRSVTYRDPTALWYDALTKFPNNARAYDNVGALMLRETPPRYHAADSMFVLAIAHDTSYFPPWLRRAAIAMKEERFRDAEAFLLRVLRVAPEDSDATAKLGRVYLAGGQPRRAIPLLIRMAERTTDPGALTALGNAYFLSGHLDSAITPLRHAIAINPRDSAAYNWLGATLVELGRGREAVAPLEQAVALDPTSGFAFGLLSIAYGESGDTDAAIRAAASAVDRGRRDAGVLVLAGRGLDAVHRPDLSQRCYREAVSLEP
ncbi:MAG TPA: tetratricopeptide repeat protein, partial [Gemmatimonadaceae bacterium]